MDRGRSSEGEGTRGTCGRKLPSPSGAGVRIAGAEWTGAEWTGARWTGTEWKGGDVVLQRATDRGADRVRLEVKPGLTCLWQVRGRSEVDFDTWMQYDREYVGRRSLLLDLEILIRTVVVVLTCRGAY